MHNNCKINFVTSHSIYLLRIVLHYKSYKFLYIPHYDRNMLIILIIKTEKSYNCFGGFFFLNNGNINKICKMNGTSVNNHKIQLRFCLK